MTTRDRDDYLRQLAEHLGGLDDAVTRFFDGQRYEFRRMSLILRTLFHDNKSSHSLAGSSGLDIKSHLEFRCLISGAGPVEEGLEQDMVGHRHPLANYAFHKSGYAAIMPIGLIEKIGGTLPSVMQNFDQWWSELVYVTKSGIRYTRSSMVLTVANKDGGAHVDPKLPKEYADLFNDNATGISFGVEGRQTPVNGSFVEASVCQIAIEALEALLAYKTELPQHPPLPR